MPKPETRHPGSVRAADLFEIPVLAVRIEILPSSVRPLAISSGRVCQHWPTCHNQAAIESTVQISDKCRHPEALSPMFGACDEQNVTFYSDRTKNPPHQNAGGSGREREG